MHPVKCVIHDGVSRDDLIQLVSISWRTPQGIQSRFCRWGVPAERQALRQYLTHATLLEGANLPFDLKMLRFADRYYHYALAPFTKTIYDFSILNYLDSELRPERSLKSVSRLLNTFTYDYVPDFKRGDRFESPTHPDALRYVHSDTIATIETNDNLATSIRHQFPNTDKLSPTCTKFYSDLLWTLILAEESGVALSTAALEALEAEQLTACNDLYQRLLQEHQLPLHGPGSSKALGALVNQTVLMLGVQNDNRLQKTPTTNAISTGMENLNFLTEVVRARYIDVQTGELNETQNKRDQQGSASYSGRPGQVLSGCPDQRATRVVEPRFSRPLHSGLSSGGPLQDVCEQASFDQETADPSPGSTPGERGCPSLEALVDIFDSIQAYRFKWRLISAYTHPILHHQIKKPDEPKFRSSRLIDGVVYPNWFPVPTTAKDDESGISGGTEQGRVTAKNPPLQVLPPAIKATLHSRYQDGVIVWMDYSQIELRVAAILSNDSVMMGEYEKGIDRHLNTGKFMLSVVDPVGNLFQWKSWTDEDYKREGHSAARWRQGGKTVNFLILFRGEWRKLRDTAARDLSIFLTQDQTQDIITHSRSRYSQFDAWQQSLINTALKQHYLALPLTGQSRYFMGTKETILSTYIPTIVNFPVQTTAANINLSLWAALLQNIHTQYLGPRIHVPLNIYDSLMADVQREVLPSYLDLLRTYACAPPYYRQLCNRLGRYLPLDVDVKIQYPDHTETLKLKGPPCIPDPSTKKPTNT